MGKQSKHYRWLIGGILAFLMLVGYLGFRAIEHEVLLTQSRMDELVQSRLNAVEDFLTALLQQKATHLDAIADYIELKEESLKELADKDVEIEQVFVLQHGKLVYPIQGENTSQKEHVFIEEFAPVIDDPSVLFAHSIDNEKTMPRSGWFLGNTPQGPLLIYWRNRADTIIGFRVSYVKLLSDVINRADFSYVDGRIAIVEHERILYQGALWYPSDMSRVLDEQPSKQASHHIQQLGARYLSYPLNGWQVKYEGKSPSLLGIYFIGFVIMFVLLTGIGFILFRIYREYTRTKREALQQVSFVSQVSHELKTPLTNITLYAELLQEEMAQQGGDQQAVDVIISESQRLSRLIQNILSFTRPSKVHLQSVDVSELITQIAQTFQPLFAAKGVELVQTIGDSVIMQTDRDRVSQIVCNFLSNAEKYAAGGKRVDLNVIQQADGVDIEVRDYGLGITPSEQQLIFQPFYRINSAITEGVSGTGIGLTISRQLADSLGAKVLVHSTKPGVCFTLRLRSGSKDKGVSA